MFVIELKKLKVGERDETSVSEKIHRYDIDMPHDGS